jgi:hypothetical protein
LAVLLVLVASKGSADTLIDLDSLVSGPGSPYSLALTAGVYSVTVVGTVGGGAYDAWNAWGSTSCAVTSGCVRTVPTTVRGFYVAYQVTSADISSVTVAGTPLTPSAVLSLVPYFLLGNYYHVDDGLVYPDASSAFTGSASAVASVFVLDVDGTVGFSVSDTGPLADNLGGLSLLVSPVAAVPAVGPSGLAVLGGLLAALGAAGVRPATGQFVTDCE